MFFLELSLTGVRGFPPQTRLSFKQGVNYATLADGTMRRALLDVIYHTMYPDSSRSGATSALADPSAPKSRVVLVFHGRDKATYRLVRDIKSGTTRLEKFQASEKKYTRLTETANEAAQYTRVQLRIPDEVAYDRLFVLCPDSQASRAEPRWRSAGGDSGSSGFAPSAPGLPQMLSGPSGMFALGGSSGLMETPELGGMTGVFPRPPWLNDQPSGLFNPTNALVMAEAEALERSRSKLEDPAPDEEPTTDPPPAPTPAARPNEPDVQRAYVDARKRLEALQKVGQAEVQLERLKGRQQELKTKGEELRAIGAERAKLTEELNSNPILRDLPAGMADRLKGLESAQEKRSSELGKIREELDTMDDAIARLFVTPLEKDPYFGGGVAGALLSLVIAYGAREPWVVGLNPVAAIAAVGAALRWVNELEARSRLEYRRAAVVEKQSRIEKAFEAETSVARKFLKEKDLDGGLEGGVESLLEVIQQGDAKRRRLTEIAGLIERARKDPEAIAAAEELPRVEQRLAQLEEIVAGGQQESESLPKLEAKVATLAAKLTAKGLSPDRIYAAAAKSEGQSRREEEEEEEEAARSRSSSRRATRRASADDDEDDEPGYGSGYQLASPRRDAGSFAEGPELLATSGGGGWGGGLPSGAGRSGLMMRPDLSRDLVQSGVDVTLLPLDALIEKIEKRLAQYISAFTRKKYTSVAFGARGEISVSAEGVEKVAFPALEPRDMDLVDAAIRLTIAEAALAKLRAPLLIDDPFAAMDPKRRKTFMQMLSYFAAVTQVVVLSPLSDFEGHAIKIES
ncbi:MAG: hypothetical protein HYV07_07945 [Deltaproteobacteria bacterium]|nr:hypothetical protein [Deltaproteobacteria bacterium]